MVTWCFYILAYYRRRWHWYHVKYNICSLYIGKVNNQAEYSWANNKMSRQSKFWVTCFAEATLGSPHSLTFFSRNSKSALPAYGKMHFIKINHQKHLIKYEKKLWNNITLPLFERQFQCQNSDIACGQAQLENHPVVQHNEKHFSLKLS